MEAATVVIEDEGGGGDVIPTDRPPISPLLICTVTPSSSSSEETHNTLKFAHRAKHIEIQAAQNKIIDEKSLIKKYQNEIRSLKEELEQLKGGIVTVSQVKHSGRDDIVILKQKLEDGEVNLQSRLEQEEEAKEALLSRIQRLTKLILVSNKSSHASKFSHPPLRRGHSFGEEELAYLPHRRRDLSFDDENIEVKVSLDGSVDPNIEVLKEEKKIKKPGLLNWLKLRKRDNLSGALTSTSDKSSGPKSISPLSTPPAGNRNPPVESIHSHSLPTECTSAEFLMEPKLDQQIDEDNFSSHETPLTSMKTIDQIDLLREQHQVLCGEVAIHLTTLKRLSEEAARDTKKEFLNVEITRLNDEIKRKNEQITLLEGQIADSATSSRHKLEEVVQSRSVSELEARLNERSSELEVKSAEYRVIQEQLKQKINECEGLQETIVSLKQLLSDAQHESHAKKEFAKSEETKEVLLLQAQAYEIEELKQKVIELTESKEQLEARNRKLAEDSSYAKGLASAAAVELTALSEEVAKLMNHNEKLTAELATPKHSPTQRKTTTGPTKNGRNTRPKEQTPTQFELKRELASSREREMSYEALISKKDKKESELQQRLEDSKQREAYLENELANMWVMVAKLKRSQGVETEPSESSKDSQRVDGWDLISCRSPTGL